MLARRRTLALTLILSLIASGAPGSPAALAQHEGHDHAPPAPAQAPGAAAPAEVPPAAVEAPETPAGKALAWVLEVISKPGDIDIAGRFTEEFLREVPAEALAQNLSKVHDALGGLDLRSITANGPLELTAVAQSRTQGSMWEIVVAVEGAEGHRISGLRFRPAPQEAIAPLKTWADADAVLNTLGATRSLAVYEVALDGTRTPVHLVNEREALPVGSTFKLFVLGALAEWIEAGGAGAGGAGAGGAPTWEESLEIDDGWKSLPSGVMQSLPQGSEAPVLEFATKMISLSDNTATDHIIKRLGRERVERFYAARVSPEAAHRTMPFLTTREMFNIKISMDPDRLEKYASANEAARRAMLTGAPPADGAAAPPGPLPPPGAAVAEPPAPGISGEEPSLMNAQQWRVPQGVDRVEWFASADEMCAVMVELWRMAQRPALAKVADVCSKNRGLPLDPEEWPYVMFKGGSEPGVLNVTWMLERPLGATRTVTAKYVVSLTVMDPAKPLDEDKAIGLAQRLIEYLQTLP